MSNLARILHDAIQDGKAAAPADLIVHWSTGPVLCCIDHAEKLIALGGVMGQHTPAEPYSGNDPCVNCVNEAQKK